MEQNLHIILVVLYETAEKFLSREGGGLSTPTTVRHTNAKPKS